MVVGTTPPGNPTTYAGWCGIPYEEILHLKIRKSLSNSIRSPQNTSTLFPKFSSNEPSRQFPQRGSNDLVYPRHTRPPNGGYNRQIGVLDTSASGSLSSTFGLEPKFERTIRAHIVNFISTDVEIHSETNLQLGISGPPVQPIQKHKEPTAIPAYLSRPVDNNGLPGKLLGNRLLGSRCGSFLGCTVPFFGRRNQK